MACASLGLAFGARADRLGFMEPEGPRHFIVLVDASNSMVMDAPGVRHGRKAAALSQAERGLADLLFGGSGIAPWYRSGRDLLTVEQFGIDTSPHAERAYLRLGRANLDGDYIRVRAHRRGDVDRREFLRLVRPARRTHLNILAWALPLGLSRAAVGGTVPVQQTFVILLNDAQLNDGGLVMEKTTMSRRLRPSVLQRLRDAEQSEQQNVRLANDSGEADAMRVMSYGAKQDPVVATVFRAVSTASLEKARKIASSHPLEEVRLRWEKRGGRWKLAADVRTASQLRGARGSLSVSLGAKKASSAIFPLGGSESVPLEGAEGSAGDGARVTLTVFATAQNPMLGTQTIGVPIETVALAPESPDSAANRMRSVVLLGGLFGLAIGGSAWAAHQRLIARNFRLFLPDYASGFRLPSVSQGATQNFVSRSKAERGEAAGYLVLPHRLVRRFLYPGALLQWEAPISACGSCGPYTARLAELPRCVRLNWAETPSGSDTFSVSVICRGRNQQLRIFVQHRACRPEPIESAGPRRLTAIS